jgi:hypothetical protein
MPLARAYLDPFASPQEKSAALDFHGQLAFENEEELARADV